MESIGEMSVLFLKEIETGEKHFFHCPSGAGTTVYKMGFPYKPARDYVVQAFYGSCLGPGRYNLTTHAHFEFRTGSIFNTFSVLLILKVFEC